MIKRAVRTTIPEGVELTNLLGELQNSWTEKYPALKVAVEMDEKHKLIWDGGKFFIGRGDHRTSLLGDGALVGTLEEKIRAVDFIPQLEEKLATKHRELPKRQSHK